MFQIGFDYNVTIDGAKFTKSPGKGTPGLELYFIDTDTNDSIKHTIWLSAGALPRSKALLIETFGMTEEELADPETLKNIGDRLRGTVCNISIVEDEYQADKGKMGIAKVSYINPPRESSDLAQVASLLSGKPIEEIAPATEKAPPPARATNQAPPAPFMSDDEALPF